ncbi:Proline--tRNA ligase [Alteripontixanthobacter maritimus]|uniref:Proline--tRNA ligase n=1 Tax=Alteripontixanthobacter maritimus TaxID=2161824 RepID=A0A369QD58_9SPHN|nr:proline--tRNA ligase [Alteripontixanthobacter maritimus]RDC60849.1 Proline--tRNA ligase [Alteripontixanthobacter maritimus]
MRLSKYVLPLLREDSSEAQIASHQLMLRAGLVRQVAAGIYAWMPLGLRVLDKIAGIVREEQDRAGAIEMLMPTIQPAELWRESGRYGAYGPEMLRIKDRHDRDLLFGPTAEEVVTSLMRSSMNSYRDLPRTLYNVQWKFRDEIRPRFGVMRGREFLMKDAYSFDLDNASARQSYNRMYVAYLRTYARMGLHAIPVKADPGPIGGDMSHEFIVLAGNGESDVFYHREWDANAKYELPDATDDSAIDAFVAERTSHYAATDEMRDESREAELADQIRTARGIEVGHIFNFGTKYSESMGLKVQARDGGLVAPQMGSYGVGISRLVGAIIEASHDDAGIVWPEAVAPFRVGIINIRANDEASAAVADKLYRQLTDAGIEVLYDDRDDRGGAKFAAMDLIGLPWQVVIGPKGVERGTFELKCRATGKREDLSYDELIARFTG